MTSIQFGKNSKYDWTELVYSIVRNNSGKVTGKQLEREIGSRYEVRYAITRLTKEGRIKRIRGFGVDKVEFFYQVVASEIERRSISHHANREMNS